MKNSEEHNRISRIHLFIMCTLSGTWTQWMKVDAFIINRLYKG